ncbi:MAG: DMT family transporter [candidate division Zixibacteria bacterium]|nr:DMT family transporter [candidate division Zixibacteria bacterium]
MNQPDEQTSLRPVLMLIFGALCVSFAAIFVKLLPTEQIGPTAIGFWRTLFGGIILFILAGIKKNKLLLPRPLYIWSALAGFLFFLDLFFWHRSIIFAGAGMATILANTQVFATAVLSFFIFKDRLTVKFFAAALSALVGVALLVGVVSDIEFSILYLRGVIFGLATGLVYAHYLVTLKLTMVKFSRVQVLTFMSWTSIFTSLFLGLSALIESAPAVPPDLYSYMILFLLGLVAQALGWWSIFSSFSQIRASRAGLILLLQPVLATVWGMLFFKEQFAPTQFLGAAVTIAAIYYGSSRK